MDKEPDIDIIELGEEIDGDLGRDETDSGDYRLDEASVPLSFKKKICIIGGAALLIVIVLVAVLSSGGSDLSKTDVNAFMTRIDRIEERVAELEGVEGRLTRMLELQTEKGLQGTSSTTDSGGAIVEQLNMLARKVEKLQDKMGSVVQEAQAIRTGKAERLVPQKARYHTVKRGESLYRIAQRYGLTVDKLCNMNKMTSKQSIYPGQKLVVSWGKANR